MRGSVNFIAFCVTSGRRRIFADAESDDVSWAREEASIGTANNITHFSMSSTPHSIICQDELPSTLKSVTFTTMRKRNTLSQAAGKINKSLL